MIQNEEDEEQREREWTSAGEKRRECGQFRKVELQCVNVTRKYMQRSCFGEAVIRSKELAETLFRRW